jgi:hypothetical protein
MVSKTVKQLQGLYKPVGLASESCVLRLSAFAVVGWYLPAGGWLDRKQGSPLVQQAATLLSRFAWLKP